MNAFACFYESDFQAALSKGGINFHPIIILQEILPRRIQRLGGMDVSHVGETPLKIGIGLFAISGLER